MKDKLLNIFKKRLFSFRSCEDFNDEPRINELPSNPINTCGPDYCDRYEMYKFGDDIVINLITEYGGIYVITFREIIRKLDIKDLDLDYNITPSLIQEVDDLKNDEGIKQWVIPHIEKYIKKINNDQFFDDWYYPRQEKLIFHLLKK